MAQRPHPGQKEEQVAVGGLVHPLFRPEAPQPKIEETTKSQESENKASKSHHVDARNISRSGSWCGPSLLQTLQRRKEISTCLERFWIVFKRL